MERYDNVKRVLLETFFGPPNVGVYSPSIQSTLYQMARATLNRKKLFTWFSMLDLIASHFVCLIVIIEIRGSKDERNLKFRTETKNHQLKVPFQTTGGALNVGVDDEKEYHVKWKELPYDECYWEFETDISTFQPEIKRFNKFRSRSSKLASMKQRSSVKDDVELKNYNM
ncbi:uncharacterized protein [Arachis hypogaea]|uniref:uncharacterized protein isoform X2 n=1 Tax=Arachis hypogaea TaxID=3818 RepID=UPI003B21D103